MAQRRYAGHPPGARFTSAHVAKPRRGRHRRVEDGSGGDVYVSGPGGLWILSPTGTHLGTIVGPEHPHNFAWGEADGKTLYLTAQTGLYRIRLNIPGTRPFAVPTN